MPAKPNAASGTLQVTPEMYARVFENHAEGALILDDLLARFGGNPYRKGDLAAARATDFHCGENNVVNFLTSQINRAHAIHRPEADPLENEDD